MQPMDWKRLSTRFWIDKGCFKILEHIHFPKKITWETAGFLGSKLNSGQFWTFMGMVTVLTDIPLNTATNRIISPIPIKHSPNLNMNNLFICIRLHGERLKIICLTTSISVHDSIQCTYCWLFTELDYCWGRHMWK